MLIKVSVISMPGMNVSLTLRLLVVSADDLCKQFESIKKFDLIWYNVPNCLTLMVFLHFLKVNKARLQYIIKISSSQRLKGDTMVSV